MNSNYFRQLTKSRLGARSGTLRTRRGSVKTPFFMPCGSRGVVKGLKPEDLKATGIQVMLANAYHLHVQPGEKLIKKLGGLHNFSSWEGPILTDSGGFQVFSLSNVRKISEEGVLFKDPASGKEVLISPEKSMQIQFDLGSDIILAFDDLTGLSLQDRPRTREAVERTHRWLLRCITEFNRLVSISVIGLTYHRKRPLLFGIVQGGLDKKLRKKSLDFVQSQSVDGIAIGGLAVGESRPEMYDMLKFLAPQYDTSRVRYLMGVGEPKDMRLAIEHGIDMFDCVLPTRNGRHGQVWIDGDRRINLLNEKYKDDPRPIDPGEIEFDESNPSAESEISRGLLRGTSPTANGKAGSTGVDKTCDCQTCQAGYSRAFLRHLFKVGDPLAGSLASLHNLRHLARLTEDYRN
ncbi:tRNA guanosine(34) transglycosylase Tgt [Candidatus Saccharibacteria bacterium]|nr:tRNA guanosine(34) transglycosylase Tgt [Candidatus Saccharibacteria bacterium]